MHRLAPVLLLGGVLLFANGVYAPATSSPAAPTARAVSISDQSAPLLTAVTAEIDRMRGRLQTVPEESEPRRDPFRFGRRESRSEPAPDPMPPPAAPEPPIVDLPRLVAVLEVAGPDGPSRTASIVFGGEVRIVKAGDRLGAFVIQSIDAAHLTMQDAATTTVYRISLR